jgi:hypothetical protein
MSLIGGLFLIFIIWFCLKTLKFVIKMTLSVIVFIFALVFLSGAGFF